MTNSSKLLVIVAVLLGLVLLIGYVVLNGAQTPAVPATPSASRPLPTSTPVAPAARASGATDVQPSLPLRAVFYYPWFPEAWKQKGIFPYTNYTPTLGFYDSSALATIQQHIAAMQYGRIGAGITSWWGADTRTDRALPAILEATAGTSFRWSIYYEPESESDPTTEQVAADLTYLRKRYGDDPAFLRINGRFVVFVYASSVDGCEMADRWKKANTVNAYIVLKVFSGYRACASQPDGWHQYAPANTADRQKGYSFTISPGFWKAEETPRLNRDLSRWYADVRAMVSSGEPFQLITSFNEWGEGTAIEPSTAWQSASGYGAYLDALRNQGEGTPPQKETPAALVIPTPAPAPTATPRPALLPTPAATPMPTRAVRNETAILAGAGDIACDPLDANFRAGLGTNTNCHMRQTSDILVALRQTVSRMAVMAVGDTQYENGNYDKFMMSYHPTWGRLKDITYPADGNHEHLTPGGAGYYQYFGAAAGDPKKGYYSYDLGAWHIVVINSMCSAVGGCDAGSAQERWLRADLAANPASCTAAYWHHPRFSSGQHGNFDSMRAIWQALADAGAEVVISGHDHDYERYAPQDADGKLDRARGLRQFVVGTGGKNHTRFASTGANSEVRNFDTYGVLKLTLQPASYEWEFVPEAGKTFTDKGSEPCH